MQSPTIISLGGSLVMPDAIDTAFVSELRATIQERIAAGERFVLIIGGGKVCRRYQEAARTLGADSQEAQDWVGIYATRLNAELVRVAFGSDAHHELVLDPEVLPSVTAPIAVGAGWKPGHSTDFDAVLMAEKSGAKRIVNLSNIDYVYDKDPQQFPDAKRIEQANWKEFRAILPKEWTPGVNVPFDPVAAKHAEALGLKVVIMNGKPLSNLKNYLTGGVFKGSVIA